METKARKRTNPHKLSFFLKYRLKSPKLLFVLLLIFMVVIKQEVWAAAGSITAIPDTGSYATGTTLNVAIRIEGGGVAFNAAKATVALLPSAPIQSIQIGDCGFAYIKTPTTSDPSFVGVILGNSSTSCTAYTMRFQTNNVGSQSISITDASIRSYQGAQEELNSVKGGNFTITQSSVGGVTPIVTIPVTPPSVDPNGNRLYSVAYSVSVPKNTSPQNVKVLLDSRTAPAQTEINQPTENEPEGFVTAKFENVPEGTHTLSVLSGKKKLDEQIVYLDGDDKNLAFGNKPTPASTPIFWYVIAGVAVLLVAGLVAGIILYRRHKANEVSTPSV